MAEAYETHNPCYDNPDYSGTFYDAHTQVNLTFDNCSAVGDFLYRSIPANTSSGEPIPYNERLGVSNSNVSNMTLVRCLGHFCVLFLVLCSAIVLRMVVAL